MPSVWCDTFQVSVLSTFSYVPSTLRTEVVGSAISAICLSVASSSLMALLTPSELRPPQHVHSLLMLKQPSQSLVATFPLFRSLEKAAIVTCLLIYSSYRNYSSKFLLISVLSDSHLSWELPHFPPPFKMKMAGFWFLGFPPASLTVPKASLVKVSSASKCGSLPSRVLSFLSIFCSFFSLNLART